MTSGPTGDRGEREAGEGSFEERLRAARSRHGLDGGASGLGLESLMSSGPSAMAIGLRVGIELVSALVVAVVIGLGLDHWLHTTPVLLAIFVLLGGAAGVANVWRLMGRKTPNR